MARRRNKVDSSTLVVIALLVGFSAVFSYPYHFLAIAALVLLAWLLARWPGRQKSLPTYDLSEIDQMDGSEFEEYVAALFCKLGYQASTTQRSRDFGVDVVAKRGAERIAIQVKRYSKAVSIGGVQEVVAGMQKYNCNKAMVVTNSYFTPAAQDLAAHCSCELIDRDGLSGLIHQATRKCANDAKQGVNQQENTANASSNHVVIACARCGQKLRLVVGKSGGVNCPSCKTTFFVST